MAAEHPVSYAAAVKHFLSILQPILQRSSSSNTACDSFLRTHNIFLTDAPGTPTPHPLPHSWLPVPPSLSQLSPAATELHSDVLDEPPSSPAEWAAIFHNALNRILRHYKYTSSSNRQPDIASLDIPQYDDLWMRLLQAGEPATQDPLQTIWQAVSLLEDGGGHVSCLLADGSPDPGSSCLLQSELVCLLSLACRQLSHTAKNKDDLHLSQVAITITTFTPTSVRHVCGFLELPQAHNLLPVMQIHKVLQISLSDLLNQPADKDRLNVLAWLCSAAPRHATTQVLVVPKRREMMAANANDSSSASAVWDTASERLFSGSSEQSSMPPSRPSSP